MEAKEEATAKAVRWRWRNGDEDSERRGWFWWSIGDGEIGGERGRLGFRGVCRERRERWRDRGGSWGKKFELGFEVERYYQLPGEHEPDSYRSYKSKNFIPKVMFMTAVARPRFDENGIELFSGKIGIFSFVVKEPTKRNSKNRTAGTMETKPIQSVTKDITRACLIEKVLPAIRAKWLASDSNNPIFLQPDNARPHIGNNDLEFIEAARQDGFDIRLCFQPSNSPDLYVLDLVFFRAIQILQYQKALKNVDELVEAVERCFDEVKEKQLNHVFLTLQSCMIEVMKDSGGNNYKVPHLNKNGLEREENLPL
ncbi:uncharacterized protein LOC124890827 [Capsicum annuum]|uniref:uncharacterized protein LOC124890827 n=1 Tax=Capsicum annuum TaxID=4072 RepID=UPI001FB122F4|nr:uncharacterized protein LOC124890827 [Capsicum annuum]